MNDIEVCFKLCNVYPLIISSLLIYFSNLKLQASCYIRLYKILFIYQNCIRVERKIIVYWALT